MAENTAGRWHPWRALRDRPDVTLHWAELPFGQPGLWIDDGTGRRRIVLDWRLPRRERRAVLAHELVHDERGIPCPPDVPPALTQREERTVERIVAIRLVPPEELRQLVDRIEGLDQAVTVDLVADEFDVPHDVAERALRLLVTP